MIAFSSLSYINEYLAIDDDGTVRTNIFRAAILMLPEEVEMAFV